MFFKFLIAVSVARSPQWKRGGGGGGGAGACYIIYIATVWFKCTRDKALDNHLHLYWSLTFNLLGVSNLQLNILGIASFKTELYLACFAWQCWARNCNVVDFPSSISFYKKVESDWKYIWKLIIYEALVCYCLLALWIINILFCHKGVYALRLRLNCEILCQLF